MRGLEPGSTIEINPAAIGFIQFAEFHKLGRRAPVTGSGFCIGDWDRVLDRSCFWSARYEGGKNAPSGMVPLANYWFLTALKARFQDAVEWEDTEWYAWMRATRPSRYKTDAKIEKRLRFLDRLHNDCLSGGYRLGGEDPPLINIGRMGRIAIEDGRHRICVAKVCGVAPITVQINAVHDGAAKWFGQ